MKRDEITLRWVGRGLAGATALYAGIVGAAACAVYHNWVLMTAVIAAYVAGNIFGMHRNDDLFYRMRDEAEESLAIAKDALSELETRR